MQNIITVFAVEYIALLKIFLEKEENKSFPFTRSAGNPAGFCEKQRAGNVPYRTQRSRGSG